jgi:hypothetical protein
MTQSGNQYDNGSDSTTTVTTKTSTADERVSLHPLDPEEAVRALLGTRPSQG